MEAGWYISDAGGIVLESDKKWYFYPAPAIPGGVTPDRVGPFKTMTKAFKGAEKYEL